MEIAREYFKYLNFGLIKEIFFKNEFLEGHDKLYYIDIILKICF